MPATITVVNNTTQIAVGENTQSAAASAASAAASAGELGGIFDPTATSPDATLLGAIKSWHFWNGKAHDYRISLATLSSSIITIDVWDEQIGDRVGYFQQSNPTYSGEITLRLVSRSRLSSAWSGLEGVIVLDGDAITPSAAVNQFTDPAKTRINRRFVKTRFEYRNRDPWDDMQEVIEMGSSRDFTSLRAVLEDLYGGALANQTNANQLPVCPRARPDYKIGILGDPQTTQTASEHIPDWVYLFSRHRHQWVFEHSPGATTPIIEGQANTGAHGCVFRSTVAGEYAWHMDYVHGEQSPDLEGDIVREYWNTFEDSLFIVGSAGTTQAYGSGIGVQAGARFKRCEFDVESATYKGSIAAANKASTTTGNVGGGRFEFIECWDKSDRTAASPFTGKAATVSVQNKIATTYPSILRIDNCRGFEKVSVGSSTNNDADEWLCTGNNALTQSDLHIDAAIASYTLGLPA